MLSWRSLGFLPFGRSVCMAALLHAHLLAPTAILLAPAAILLAPAAILRAATAIALITPPGRTCDVARRRSLCQEFHGGDGGYGCVWEEEELPLACALHIVRGQLWALPTAPSRSLTGPRTHGPPQGVPPVPSIAHAPRGRSKCQESAGSGGADDGGGNFIFCRFFPTPVCICIPGGKLRPKMAPGR